MSSNYNLIRICGFFGYVTGAIVFVILTAFIISLFIKAYKNKDSVQPSLITAVSVLGLRYAASVLINCGIRFGYMDARIPILSDGVIGYFIIGLLLGAIFTDKGMCDSIKHN